ncbi:hypothetical protein NX029_21685 [Cytobacillus firmus]|uniref:hypothetical protein n=1 Tax=Cytobacillus TaxID=2675230 RepID=UPI00203B828C|nr:hypothetical protein [Cytobacillus oceanisediminis]MCM3243890.1 hypothetical protein [Cytobacillus oceanisediminis]MCS0826543.1 hypothetical protein [Cytobacillus firmus]
MEKGVHVSYGHPLCLNVNFANKSGMLQINLGNQQTIAKIGKQIRKKANKPGKPANKPKTGSKPKSYGLILRKLVSQPGKSAKN